MNTQDEPQAFDGGGVFVPDDYFPGFETINTTHAASENDEHKEQFGGALLKTNQTQSTEFAGDSSEELRDKGTPAEAWSRLLIKSLAMSKAQDEVHVDDSHKGATMENKIKETQRPDRTDDFEEGMGLLSLFLSEDTYATLASLDGEVVFSFVSRILSETSVRARSVLVSLLRLLLEANDEAKELLLPVRATAPRPGPGVGAEQMRHMVSDDEPTRTAHSTGNHEGSFFEVMSSVANEQARKLSNLSQHLAVLRLQTYEALRGVLAFIIRMGLSSGESTTKSSLDLLLCRAAVFVLLPSLASNRSHISEPWIVGDTAIPVTGELTFVNREILPFLAAHHSFHGQSAREVPTGRAERKLSRLCPSSEPETNTSAPLFSDTRSPNITCEKNPEDNLTSMVPSNVGVAASSPSPSSAKGELEHHQLTSIQGLSYCVSSSSDWGNLADRLVSGRSSSRRASVDIIPLPTSDAFTLVVGDILFSAIVGRALSSLVPCWISDYFFSAWEAVSDIGTLVDESICGPLEVAEKEWRASEGSRSAKAGLLQMRSSRLLSEPTASSSAAYNLTQEQNNQKGEEEKSNVQTEVSNVQHIHIDSSSASISSEAHGTECEGINAERSYSTCNTKIVLPLEHVDNPNVTDDNNNFTVRATRVNLSASALNGSQDGNDSVDDDKGRSIRELETPNKMKGLTAEEKVGEAIGGHDAVGERRVHDNDSIMRSSKVVKAVRQIICGRILGHTEKTATRKLAKKRSKAKFQGENTSMSARTSDKRSQYDVDKEYIDDDEDNGPFGSLNRNYLTEQGVYIIVSPLAKLIIVAAILFVWLATFLSYRITRETLRRFDRLESIAAEQRRDILLTKRLRKKRAIASTIAAGAPFPAAAPTTTHPSGLNKSLLGATCPSPAQHGGTPSNHHQSSHHNSRRASGVPQYSSASPLHISSPALQPAQHARIATNSSPSSSGQFSRRDLHVHVASDTTNFSHGSPQSYATHNHHSQLHHGVPSNYIPVSRNQLQSAHSPSTVSLQPRVGGVSQGTVDQRRSPSADRDLLAFPAHSRVLPAAQVTPMDAAAVRLCHSGADSASSESSTPQTSPRHSPTRSLSLSPAVSGRSRSTTTVSKGPSSFNSTSRPSQSLDNTATESSNTRIKGAAHVSGSTVVGLDPRRGASGADSCTERLPCIHEMAQAASKFTTYACAGVPPLAPSPSRGVHTVRAPAAVQLTPSDIHLEGEESGSQNSVLPLHNMETTTSYMYASSLTTASPDIGSNTLSLGSGIEDGDSGLVIGPLTHAGPTNMIVASGSVAERNMPFADLTVGRDDPLAQLPQPQTNGPQSQVGRRSPPDEDAFSSRAISSLLDS